jgi:hypothetical protein
VARPKQGHDKRSKPARAAAEDRVWLPRLAELERARNAAGSLTETEDKILAAFDRDLAENPPSSNEDRRYRYDEMMLSLRRARKPFWKTLTEIEAGRNKQDAAEFLPFGDRAVEAIRALREELDAIEGRAGKAGEYRAFLRKRFVPEYNRRSTVDRMCERCFQVFALVDSRGRYCSDNCSSAVRNRGRKHDGLSEAARTERLKRRLSREVEAHVKKGCQLCKSGDPCRTRERILGAFEPLVVPSSAEAIDRAHHQRRTPDDDTE